MFFKYVLESHVVECFNGVLYPQRFQKLIYLHLFTDCFMKISPQLVKTNTVCVLTTEEKPS